MTRSVELAHRLRDRKAFIFDLDGTLADTSPIHETAFRTVMAPLGIKVDYPSIAGLTTESAILKLLGDRLSSYSEAGIAELVERKRAIARQSVSQNVQFLPGAMAFVELAQTLARLAIYSSGSRETVTTTLAALNIANLFNCVLSGEDVNRPKPAPDGFLNAIDRLSVGPNEALVFEDAESGISAARAAGLEVIRIAMNKSGLGPEKAVQSANWFELTNALEMVRGE
jgi:HAD superfamily hydrolase (TIGR01509 family)